MSPCARGCCFTGLQVCAKARSCACHWDERRPGSRSNGTVTYRDPTAEQAVSNVMKERKGK